MGPTLVHLFVSMFVACWGISAQFSGKKAFLLRANKASAGDGRLPKKAF